MCRNILDALKPLYYQLKIAGLTTFKFDDTGAFKERSKHIIFICCLSSIITITCILYYIFMIQKLYVHNSLFLYLLETYTLASGLKILITDIFRCINRHKMLCMWQDIYLTDNVFLINGVRSNYKLIKYIGSIIIWGQIFSRILIFVSVPSERKNIVILNILVLAVNISYFRNALVSNELITLRIIINCYFNNYFVLLQKINTSATQLNQSKLLESLHFRLCKLSLYVDRVTSPQILINLMESFLGLNIFLYHVIAPMIGMPENNSVLTNSSVLYLIFDYIITIAYTIMPGYICVNMVSICYLNLDNCLLAKKIQFPYFTFYRVKKVIIIIIDIKVMHSLLIRI